MRAAQAQGPRATAEFLRRYPPGTSFVETIAAAGKGSLKSAGTAAILYISPLVESLAVNVPIPFAVLLPAYSEGEVMLAKEIVAALLDLGCIEFCCVGSLAEQLHDSIDEIIEDREMFSIVTTFHNDVSEACEYFVFAAGGGACLHFWLLRQITPSSMRVW